VTVAGGMRISPATEIAQICQVQFSTTVRERFGAGSKTPPSASSSICVVSSGSAPLWLRDVWLSPGLDQHKGWLSPLSATISTASSRRNPNSSMGPASEPPKIAGRTSQQEIAPRDSSYS